ncbi:ornithine cyclodeaminase family protein [Polaromonas jejuensis]|uniref:ornithine cyclodeaminase family protein n=1 Tax=Polaromonas jejuensis TaxID=457502 RepID=UPI000A074799|nr:ornithine cyclodeaminase family protein [Polaromonas jejuensis]
METSVPTISPIFVDAASVARHLPWPALLQALQQAFAATDLSTPTRAHHHMEGMGGSSTPVLLSMPAWSPRLGVGVKLVTVYPDNASLNLPSIHGLYVLMDGATGRPQAVLEAGELTARRTAAASALASRFLSRPDSSTLLMVGTGRLSQYLPLAHAEVRPIKRVLVWGRSLAKAQESADALRAQGVNALPVAGLQEACAEADIISCATLSKTSLLRGDWLRPGTHVDLVGAFTPQMREADDQVFQRAASVWCDTTAGALAEAGDLIQSLASGALDNGRIKGDLLRLCQAGQPVSRHDADITVFKSVGAALEDLAAARLCLERLSPDSIFSPT